MQNYACYNFIMNFLAVMLTKKILNVLKRTPTHSTWHCPAHLLRTSFLHPSDMNFIPISITGSLLNLVPVTASSGSKKSVFFRTGRLMSAVWNSSARTNAPLGYLKQSGGGYCYGLSLLQNLFRKKSPQPKQVCNGLNTKQNVFSLETYLNVIKNQASGFGSNKSFRVEDNTVYTCEQVRSGLSYFYPKRLVLVDAVSTGVCKLRPAGQMRCAGRNCAARVGLRFLNRMRPVAYGP